MKEVFRPGRVILSPSGEIQPRPGEEQAGGRRPPSSLPVRCVAVFGWLLLYALLTWRWNHEAVRLYDAPPVAVGGIWAAVALFGAVLFWFLAGAVE